jgi:2-polyprenyl-6-methoxyphenol hydroxylase-like FAD-dependent oxidoreductase
MKQTVEIVGAGIAGLTTGLAFAQKGWRVRVHEQRNALCNRREGIFVWENGLRVLDALGVLTPAIAGAGGSAHTRGAITTTRRFRAAVLVAIFGFMWCSVRLW